MLLLYHSFGLNDLLNVKSQRPCESAGNVYEVIWIRGFWILNPNKNVFQSGISVPEGVYLIAFVFLSTFGLKFKEKSTVNDLRIIINL